MADDQARIVFSAVDKTKQAFDSIRRNTEQLTGNLAGLTARFGTIGLAITGAFTGASLKGVIDAGDELNKLSQKTGISVEALSSYKVAAELSDVSQEEFSRGVKTLSINMSAAAGGSKEQAAAFKAIGVEVKNGAGGLRNIDDVLGDVADRFAGYSDGAEKAALAQDLFGKSGAALIPLLNGGRRGLQEARDEAQKLGVVFSADLAKQAEQFNDNLTRISLGVQGAKVALLGELLPALVRITEQLVQGREAYGGFLSALTDAVNINPFKGLQENIETSTKRLADIKAEIADLQSVASRGISLGGIVGARTEKLQTEQKTVESRLTFLRAQQSSEALAKAGNVPDDPRLRRPAQTPKRNGLDPAEQALRERARALQAALQGLQEGLQRERDLYTFQQRFTDGTYRDGLISLKDFYAAEDSARERNVAAQRAALDEELKLRQQFLASIPKDPKFADERIAAQGAVNDTRTRRQQLDLRAAQDAVLAQQEASRATEQLQRNLDAFRAQLEDLRTGGVGDAQGLVEIAEKVKKARDLLVAGGATGAQADSGAAQLRAALEAQRAFNLAREEFARITDRARDAEDALVLAQQANGTGLLEREQQLHDLREQGLRQIDALIVAERQRAALNPDNVPIQDNLRRLELERQRLQQVVDPRKLRLDAAADNIGDAIADGLARAVVEGEKLSDVIRSIDKAIVATVTQEVFTKPLADSIGTFIKGSGGQGGGENLIGALFGQNQGSTQSLGDVFGRALSSIGSFFGIGGSAPSSQAAGIGSAAAAIGAGSTELATKLAAEAANTAAVTANTAAATASSTATTTAAASTTALATAATPAATQLATLAASATAAAAALQAVAGSQGAAGAGKIASGLEGLSSEALSFFFHDGGVVGEARDIRPAVALASNEVPAVLLKGEEVLTHDDPRHIRNLGHHAVRQLQQQAQQLGQQQIVVGPALSRLAASTVRAHRYHSGGIAGQAANRGADIAAPLPADVWTKARRYHTGGIAGSAPNAPPSAVRRRVEEVMLQADARQQPDGGGNGRSGDTIVVQVQATPNMRREVALQQGEQIGRGLAKARQRNG